MFSSDPASPRSTYSAVTPTTDCRSSAFSGEFDIDFAFSGESDIDDLIPIPEVPQRGLEEDLCACRHAGHRSNV
jgi:hypothetical protein